MNPNFFPYFMPLLLLTLAVEESQAVADDNEESRQPRVNGRIVKLYSGTRPDPVYCSEEGFQADPLNCAIFYRCVKSFNGKYTVFRYQCGPGTVFDPETQICNFPRNTKRSECGGMMTLPNNEHINEIVGAQSELPKPISTKAPIFSQTEVSTKNPWATTQRQDFDSSSAYPWVTTSASLIPVQSNKPSSQSGEICTTDGFMGDSEDCRKFYRCVSNLRGGFIRYEYSCTESTIWDDDAQTCNHPWAVQRRRCGRGNLDNKDTSTSNKPNDYLSISNEIEHQQTQTNYGAKVTQMQTSRKPVQQTEYYRDPSSNYGGANYNTYLMQTPMYENYLDSSVNAQKQEQTTGHTTQSHSYETSSLRPSSTLGYNEDVDNGYGSNTDTMNEKPNTSEDKNNNKCTQSGFMGDGDDCRKFYRCVDNGKGGYIKYEFSCGEGTVWDSKIEACNHAWAVPDCKQKAPLEQSTTSTKSTQNYESTTIIMSSSTVTENYHTTTTAISITDEDVGYGNQNQQTTSYPNTTTVTINSDTICSSSGFIGDENDCKKFYRCVENGKGSYTKYEFSCGEGTSWDPEINACNHASAVKRCGSTTDINKIDVTSSTEHVSITSTTTQKSPDNIDIDSGYGKPETDKPYSTTTSKQPQEQETNKNNECTTSGFMGDSNDCKKFYRCVDNGDGSYTRYEFSCGEGTVWDSKIDACNHAWAVEKCGSASVSDGNGETLSPILSDEEIHTTQTMELSSSSTEKPQISSSTTEKMTQESNNCTNSGFMGDTNDCTKFYRCVDNGRGGFIRYEFSCGEGTVWDQSIEACNHKWAVKECGGSSNNSIDMTFETTSSIPMTSSEVGSSQVQETSEHPSSAKPQDLNNKICTNEGFVGDSNDCRKFYRCVDDGRGGYIKYEFTCGEGTVWDSEINTCNHPSSDNSCAVNNNNNEVHTSTTYTTIEPPQHDDEVISESPGSTSTIYDKDEDNKDDSESSNSLDINMSKCEAEGFYGDPSDCKKFYRCVDNGKGGFIKYNFSCGEGTVWDQEILACNHGTGSNCSRSPSNTTPSQSPTSTTTSSPSSSYATDSSETTRIPLMSQNKCDSEGFFADSDDCRKFYRCVDNGKGSYTKYDFTCGEGTIWVQETLACDHDDGDSNCSRNIGANTDSSVSGSTQTTQSTITSTRFPVSSSTESEKEPVEQPVMQDEEVNNNNDNSVQSSTEKNNEQSSESSKPEHSGTCKEEGFFGNPEDCKKFYRCVDNGKGGYTKYDFTCGEGTIWDQDLTTCNHPQDVSNSNCKQSETNSNTSETQGTSSSTTDSSGSTTSSTTESNGYSGSSTTEKNQSSSNCSQEDTSKKPDNQNITCTKEGYYPNPNDCKKFYRCVDWDGNGEKFSVYHFECGEGTIWDPALDTCNHEDSVYPPRNCSGSQSQNENQGSSTTESTTITQEESTSTQSTTSTTSSEENSTSSESTTTQQPIQQSTTEQQSTSSEPTTTTQHSTTIEQTTTQQSTTSEQTTTQQSTTSEQTTTQQSATSEQTTTQQSTTSEQTTQQSTTSEQTTTQESTTSEQTTQQSTTSEQTTTQESTSSEQTNQQSTSSEPTTTQQSTTSDLTTTQQSTTSEQSTTQQSTTSDQSTTTTEQTTTQQSTTSDQSTTQQSTTTEQTQQSTTEQMTTQQSTTQQSSTTDESTTQQSTTQQSTTEQSTTNEGSETTSSTTQQTNESSTTESSESTTESSSSTGDKCPETDEDQNLFVCPTSFRRHPKYCNLFYQCTEDEDNHDVQIAMFRCPNNTIYDENQTKCVEENKANKKCNGEIAQKRRVKRLNTEYKEPIVVSKEKMKCPAVGYFSFENEECSAVFLKCQKSQSNKLRGMVYKCPEGHLYWSVSKRCEKKKSVDFCKSSSLNNWNKRWEIPTERRNVAL